MQNKIVLFTRLTNPTDHCISKPTGKSEDIFGTNRVLNSILNY